MLVVDKARAVALRLRNPAPVLEAIPTAEQHMVRGMPMVIVPHRLDEVKVLNNLGFGAPSPIEHYYDWPGRFTPFAHQRKTAGFLTLHRKAIVLNDIGTAKTLSTLWAADYLMRQGRVRKVLILSPVSTLESVWGNEIFTNLYDRKFVVLTGAAARRHKLLKQEVDFYICNHDGFKVIYPEIKAGMFDLLVVDEAPVYRNPQSQRYKLLYKFVGDNPDMRLWMLTGTPTPEKPTDAWTLGRLLGNPDCPRSFTRFRDMVMHKVSMWKYVSKPDAADTVSNILKPSIRFSREECIDLPPTLVQTREVPMSAEQKKAYNQMLRRLIAEVAAERISGGVISAVNEASKLIKLIQISLGTAYGDGGEVIELPCASRMNELTDIITEAGEKVIVFVPLTGALRRIERELKPHWSVAVVNGDVPARERTEIFRAFQQDENPRVLVAHPAAMAHGVTLTAATTIVWYGPPNSNEIYMQANGRIERPGKTKTSTVVHIASTDVEKRMYARLQSKQDMQGVLLDIINHKGEPQWQK